MKNIGVWVTIGIFLVGLITGWGKLQAISSAHETKLDKLETKIEEVKEKADKTEVNQTAMEKQLDKMEDKLDKIVDAVVKKK
jgi:F0F1-type ATP synthase membrane subunit b/b'